MLNSSKEFWIINISKFGVSLSDLKLTIPPGRTMNLLSKHFHYTAEQLEDSVTSGSLFKKSDKIKLRNAPGKFTKPTLELSTDFREVRKRTMVKVEEFNYDELPSLNDDAYLSDQKFAEEYADDEIK